MTIHWKAVEQYCGAVCFNFTQLVILDKLSVLALIEVKGLSKSKWPTNDTATAFHLQPRFDSRTCSLKLVEFAAGSRLVSRVFFPVFLLPQKTKLPNSNLIWTKTVARLDTKLLLLIL